MNGWLGVPQWWRWASIIRSDGSSSLNSGGGLRRVTAYQRLFARYKRQPVCNIVCVDIITDLNSYQAGRVAADIQRG